MATAPKKTAAAKPAAAKAAALAADKPLRDLFESWLADGVSRKDGNAELRRTFEKDVLPTIGPDGHPNSPTCGHLKLPHLS